MKNVKKCASGSCLEDTYKPCIWYCSYIKDNCLLSRSFTWDLDSYWAWLIILNLYRAVINRVDQTKPKPALIPNLNHPKYGDILDATAGIELGLKKCHGYEKHNEGIMLTRNILSFSLRNWQPPPPLVFWIWISGLAPILRFTFRPKDRSSIRRLRTTMERGLCPSVRFLHDFITYKAKWQMW